MKKGVYIIFLGVCLSTPLAAGFIPKPLSYSAVASGGVSIGAIKSATTREIDNNLSTAGQIFAPTGSVQGWAGFGRISAGIEIDYLQAYKNVNAGADNSLLTGGAGNFRFSYLPVSILGRYEILPLLNIAVGGGAAMQFHKAEVTRFSGQTYALRFSGITAVAVLAISYEYPVWKQLSLIGEFSATYIFDKGLHAAAASALFGSTADLSGNTLLLVPRIGALWHF